MRRFLALSAPALVGVFGLSAPQAMACGWLWACGDRAYVYRDAPRAYGYRGPARVRLYSGARSYGYTYAYRYPYRYLYPYAYPYSAWSSTTFPPRTALPGASTEAVGLTVPITSAPGLAQSAFPARGPTLFGPSAPPAAWGYYYGSYYGSPAYGFYAVPSPGTPPQQTPSWWVEPRRRR